MEDGSDQAGNKDEYLWDLLQIRRRVGSTNNIDDRPEGQRSSSHLTHGADVIMAGSPAKVGWVDKRKSDHQVLA